MKLHEVKPIEKDVMPLCEMANFDSSKTGFKGWTFISTEMGEHDARVKWYPDKPSRKGPCLIVTVPREAGKQPKIENHHLDEPVAAKATKNVEAWISKNRDKILKFWDEGYSMGIDEVHEFLSSFEKA